MERQYRDQDRERFGWRGDDERERERSREQRQAGSWEQELGDGWRRGQEPDYGRQREYGQGQWGREGQGSPSRYGQGYGSQGYGGSPYGSTMGYGPSSQYGQQQQGRWQQRRGPKGYQRSDDRIREEIYEQLIQREHLDAEEVTVTVKDGNVTLEGTVPERRMKHEIEDIADQCIGVKDVDNKIRVKREGGLLGAIFGERDEEQRGKGASGTTAGGASSRTRRE